MIYRLAFAAAAAGLTAGHEASGSVGDLDFVVDPLALSRCARWMRRGLREDHRASTITFPRPGSRRCAGCGQRQSGAQGGSRRGEGQGGDRGLVPLQKRPAAKPDPAGRVAKKHPVIIPDVTPTTDAPVLSMTEQMVIGAAIDLTLLFMLATSAHGLTSRSPLRDLGLSFKRWWQQAAVGIVALLAIHPVVYRRSARNDQDLG